MDRVTERIFKGAMNVFVKKGLQGTTQEVAKEADVAEVTLYRRYSTKENLFITVLKNVLEKKFHSHVLKIAKEEDTELFFMKIIENRLELLSKNNELVKMLLSETLRGNLTDHINLPKIIYSSLQEGLAYHFAKKEENVNIEFCAQQLGGIFLSYVILPTEQQYHTLTPKEKENIAKRHASAILATL